MVLEYAHQHLPQKWSKSRSMFQHNGSHLGIPWFDEQIIWEIQIVEASIPF